MSGSHSNSSVVVYFLSWAVFGITRPTTLIMPQNPRRNHCTPISSDADGMIGIYYYIKFFSSCQVRLAAFLRHTTRDLYTY